MPRKNAIRAIARVRWFRVVLLAVHLSTPALSEQLSSIVLAIRRISTSGTKKDWHNGLYASSRINSDFFCSSNSKLPQKMGCCKVWNRSVAMIASMRDRTA